MSKIYVGETPISAVFMGGKRYDAIMKPDSKVPTDYRQVEYIESTGTQYIDTGIYCSNMLSVSLKMQFTSSVNNQFNGAILDDGGMLKRYHVGIPYDSSVFSIELQNTQVVTASSNININEYYISSTKCQINNIIKTGNWSTNLPDTLTFWLFYRNGAGRESWTHKYCQAKLYSCQMWENNNLVRDFIPVTRVSDLIIGLYDTVSKTFFTDANGGNFIGGDPV